MFLPLEQCESTVFAAAAEEQCCTSRLYFAGESCFSTTFIVDSKPKLESYKT